MDRYDVPRTEVGYGFGITNCPRFILTIDVIVPAVFKLLFLLLLREKKITLYLIPLTFYDC